MLDSHQQHGLDNVLGTLDSVRVEGNEVIGLIRFSTRPEIAPLLDDVRSGVIQHLSVGYQVAQWRDGTDASGTRTRTAVKWTIREASFVAVPADRNAHTRMVPARPGRVRRSTGKSARWRPAPVSVPTWSTRLIDRNATVAEAREEILFELQIRSASVERRQRPQSGQHRQSGGACSAMGEALYTRIAPRHAPSGAGPAVCRPDHPRAGPRVPDPQRRTGLRRPAAPA